MRQNHFTELEHLELVARRIAESGCDITREYNDWINVTFACASLGEAARKCYHTICRQYPRYQYDECDKCFDNCLRTGRGDITLGTLIKLAKDNGIDTSLPKGRRPKSQQAKEEEQKNQVASIKEKLTAQYRWRKNTLTDKVEYSADGDSWAEVDDRLVNTIITRLREEGWRVSDNMLRSLIDSSDFSVDYNPITDYLDSLVPWNPETDPDYIHEMFVGHMEFKNPEDADFYDMVFHRWFVCMVALWLGRIPQNPLLPTFCGPENIGKTFLCKHILPPILKYYWTEVRPNDPFNTDTMLILSKMLLVILDEIRINSDSKSNMLKYLLTSTQTNLRASYDRYSKTRNRLASTIATTNYQQFIREEEGNRRFVGIDIVGTKNLNEFPINHDGAYSQALYLLKNDYQLEPTQEEYQLIKVHNRDYMQLNDCEEALRSFVREPGTCGTTQNLLPGELLQELNNKGFRGQGFNTIEIGKAMKHLGFEKKHSNRGSVYRVSLADYDYQKRERSDSVFNTVPAPDNEVPETNEDPELAF